MPARAPKRAAEEHYDSDGGFVEDAPKSKKSKGNGNGKASISQDTKKDEDGNEYWDLSNKRRLGLSEFKKQTFVNIREYYQDSAGAMKPGKKGISLSIEQFNAVVELLPKVEEALRAKGIDVPRPQYDQMPSEKATVEDDDGALEKEEEQREDTAFKSAKSKLDRFKHKANHEATSDEDEG